MERKTIDDVENGSNNEDEYESGEDEEEEMDQNVGQVSDKQSACRSM